MRRLTLFSIVALLVMAAGGLIVQSQGSGLLSPLTLTPNAPEGSEWVEVDGQMVPIAPGTTVQVEFPHFAYPADSLGAPEGTEWIEADGMVWPLAPGTTVQVDESREARIWSGTVPEIDVTIQLDVPLFSQNDPAWKNNVMQTCGQTIGAAGCALTSTAMVFKYYGAVNKNPGQLNTCLGHYACPIYWAVAATACSENKATFVEYWTFSYPKLQSMLSAGRPPIVKLVKGDSTHFVVVRSGSGSQPSNYHINDPWDGMIKQLSAYIGAGWVPDRIAEYAQQ